MEPIQFFNRYTGEIEAEEIYGEAWLRWAYETAPGRIGVEAVAKRAWFSRWYGWRMNSPKSRQSIADFIEKFALDSAEFAPAQSFSSFNDFFRRELKPEARPIDPNPDSAVFPADGRHLAVADLSQSEGFYVKGQKLSLAQLLGDSALAQAYQSGCAVFSRLCPVDYHRFHFCAAGTPAEPVLLDGVLYSVSPLALRRNIGYLGQNKRVLTALQTPRIGRVLVLEIGATNVGSIRQNFAPGREIAKGAEKGWFEFGGSMVVTVFEPGRIRLAEDLAEQGAVNREIYAKMGDVMGTISG